MTVTSQPAGGTTSSRRMRSDARRNVARVLEAAEEVFASEGIGVPVDVIAERAGVGVGTLYRHFPTKEALFEAIVVHRLEALIERARELADAPDPGEALFAFVGEIAKMATEKRDLLDELARAGVDSMALHAEAKAELESTFGALLGRAQAAGDVRPDITAPEIGALLMATCLAAGMRGVSESCDHLVKVVCDGLRPTSPVSRPPARVRGS
ncbi:MAG TPA: TetR/AcrR family transcriptional regulator [Acidimicrobiales bacterium]|nr:TetR/AcrR family transcriptional regulator [Acidimicrobiales bacterium]